MEVDDTIAEGSQIAPRQAPAGRIGDPNRPLEFGFAFKRVPREPRLSDKVASRILEVIVDSSLDAGEALPSERDLGTQFGVSRTVIREALRSLAGKGVVEMTQGRGLRVARVEPSTVRESMSLYLRSRPALDYARVHEVRALLETEVAGIAAERATASDLEALFDSCEQMAQVLSDPQSAAEADVAFHRLLAQSTHNELFTVLLDAIAGPLVEIRVETFETVDHRADVALDAHRTIYREVSRRASQAARAAMCEHLDDVLLAWRRVTAQLRADQAVPPSASMAPTE
ncbi:MAG: FadR/GntR family transcriptional regulator [Candidatus Limnocylindrales bacterium]|jgi:GntR family transcriptional repressor for pyruvate dehydrogenase complex